MHTHARTHTHTSTPTHTHTYTHTFTYTRALSLSHTHTRDNTHRALQMPPELWLRWAVFNCGITHICISSVPTPPCCLFACRARSHSRFSSCLPVALVRACVVSPSPSLRVSLSRSLPFSDCWALWQPQASGEMQHLCGGRRGPSRHRRRFDIWSLSRLRHDSQVFLSVRHQVLSSVRHALTLQPAFNC